MKVFKNRSQSRNVIRSSEESTLFKSLFTGLNLDALFRLFLVWLVLVGGSGGLIWRLHKLQIEQQVTNGEGDVIDLPKRAKLQQTSSFRPYIPRRSVVDANGNVVSLDKVAYKVYIHPIIVAKDTSLLEEAKEKNVNWQKLLSEKLAGILADKEANEVLKLLDRRLLYDFDARQSV